MKQHIAFMVMGPHYDTAKDNAMLQTQKGNTAFVTVRDLEEAKTKAVQLMNDGYGVIEVCGAFGEEGAKALIEVTGGKVGIGYVVHLPEQDKLFNDFFTAFVK